VGRRHGSYGISGVDGASSCVLLDMEKGNAVQNFSYSSHL